MIGRSRNNLFAPLNKVVILPVSTVAAYTVVYVELNFLFFASFAEGQLRLMKYLTSLGIFNRGKNAEKLIMCNEETLLHLGHGMGIFSE